MELKIDYEPNTTTDAIPISPHLYADFAGFWYCHVYVLAFGFFSVAFCCFFAAINIRSQYPLQTLMFIACVLQIFTGLVRSGFLMLDPYGAHNRLPLSLLTFLFSLGFPSLTATVAMTVFSIAKHCLKTEPKSFIWLIVLFHYAFSITAEIIAVNEQSWSLFLQTVTTIFMLWPLGLALLFGNIRKSLQKLTNQHAQPVLINNNDHHPPQAKKPKQRRARDRRRYATTAAQTSFVRRPTPKPKSKSCGTLNDTSIGSQLTIPTSSVVSIDSLESWDHLSLQGSPRGSPVLARHLSMPSVTTGRKFWTQRFAFRKNFKLSSPNVSLQNRKLKGIQWHPKKSSESKSGNSAEREAISGDDSDQVIHKDQDSTVINYFTSDPQANCVTIPIIQLPTPPVVAVAHIQQLQPVRRSSSANTANKQPLISRDLWKLIRAHYLLIVLYLTFCGLYLFSVFKFPVDIKIQTKATVWDWFVFQSCLRTMELMVAICLAYIVDHAGALDSCNLCQRELLRI